MNFYTAGSFRILTARARHIYEVEDIFVRCRWAVGEVSGVDCLEWEETSLLGVVVVVTWEFTDLFSVFKFAETYGTYGCFFDVI